MSVISLFGSDAIILNEVVFSDFADGIVGQLTFPNDLTTTTAGANGNAVIAKNADGQIAELELRILIGTANDKQLNSWLAKVQSDLASFILIEGEVTKWVGDGQGNKSPTTYFLSGGVPVKIPDAQRDESGSGDQGVAVWLIRFANGVRKQ